MTEDEEGARLADSYELEVKAAALREFADLVDRGPAVPLSPGIYSSLAREKAEDAESEAERLREGVPSPFDTCHVVEVDGEPVRVQGGAELDAEGRAALGSVVRAAKRRLVEEKAAERAEVERQVRAQVVLDIECERDTQIHQDPALDPEDELARWVDDVYQRCIRIVRGEA